MFQLDLGLVQYFKDALEQVAIDDRLAFFQEKVGSLSNETVLVADQTILKGSEIAPADSFHEGFEFFQSVFVQHCEFVRNAERQLAALVGIISISPEFEHCVCAA